MKASDLEKAQKLKGYLDQIDQVIAGKDYKLYIHYESGMYGDCRTVSPCGLPVSDEMVRNWARMRRRELQNELLELGVTLD